MNETTDLAKERLRRSLPLQQVVTTLVKTWHSSQADVCMLLADVLQLVPEGEKRPVEFFISAIEETVLEKPRKGKAPNVSRAKVRYPVRGGEASATSELRRVARDNDWNNSYVGVSRHSGSLDRVALAKVHCALPTVERVLKAKNLPIPERWMTADETSAALASRGPHDRSRNRREDKKLETKQKYNNWIQMARDMRKGDPNLTIRAMARAIASQTGYSESYIRRQIKEERLR